ncbi:TetR/AcrR family transcriptional regulator [Nonomuraea sp. NPDC049480]|uniref:TetR/AcrR family transcriptional regulator n=1 Tax=Nonomuraea sp. NPDC049480 TaxID=3364353 RepID=UPI00378B4666
MRARPPKERADAARNREKVLAAAARLFAEKGVEAVSMDAIAAAAEVGKGTLFRRFGDKSGLAVALLDTRERDLQQRILSGPPPLGPGAPARDRLAAFVAAYLGYLFDHLDLVRMSETASPGARYRIGAYRFWHRHVSILLAESRPGMDADVLSHVLLAAVGAEAAGVLRDEYGRDRAIDGITALALAVVNPP